MALRVWVWWRAAYLSVMPIKPPILSRIYIKNHLEKVLHLVLLFEYEESNDETLFEMDEKTECYRRRIVGSP